MTRYFTILLAALAPTFVISDAVAQEDNAIVDRHIAAAARAAKADLLGPLTFVPVLSSAGSRGAVLAVQIANLVLVWMIGAWWMWHMVIGVD